MRDEFPLTHELPYRPSRAKQVVFLAMLLVAFIVTTGVALLLYPVDARDFNQIVVRTLIHSLKGLLLVVCAVIAIFSVVSMPILMIQILLHRPAFTLTVEGIRLPSGVVVAWEEIDEIHEHVNRAAPGPIQQVVIGIYVHDEHAIGQRLGRVGRWQMAANKKHSFPPIVLATHHLHESVSEILDNIEVYLADLWQQEDQKKHWPMVFRRND